MERKPCQLQVTEATRTFLQSTGGEVEALPLYLLYYKLTRECPFMKLNQIPRLPLTQNYF